MKETTPDHVTPGDMVGRLDERGRFVPVTTVRDISRGESCNGVHVNGTQCWDRSYRVWVKRATA